MVSIRMGWKDENIFRYRTANFPAIFYFVFVSCLRAVKYRVFLTCDVLCVLENHDRYIRALSLRSFDIVICFASAYTVNYFHFHIFVSVIGHLEKIIRAVYCLRLARTAAVCYKPERLYCITFCID